MRHQRLKKMLSVYVDGRLSSKQEKLVKSHLDVCAECRALLRSFQQLSRAVAEPLVKVNPFFAARVLADLAVRKRERFWQVFDLFPRPIIITGLAVSIVILIVFAGPLDMVAGNAPTSEYAMLFDDQSPTNRVTDDQALAIAINGQAELVNGD